MGIPLPPRRPNTPIEEEERWRNIEDWEHDHVHTHDHGGQTGLGDDDHSQYHTDGRHDARTHTSTATGGTVQWGNVAIETTFGLAYSAGSGGGLAREQHRHGTPPDPWVPANRPVLDAVRVRRTTSQTIPYNTETTIVFQQKVHGKASMWNNGSGILIPNTGLYDVGGEVWWNNGIGKIQVETFHLIAGGRVLTDPHEDGGSYDTDAPGGRAFSFFQNASTNTRLIAGEVMTMTVLHSTVDSTTGAGISTSVLFGVPGTSMWATYLGPCDA